MLASALRNGSFRLLRELTSSFSLGAHPLLLAPLHRLTGRRVCCIGSWLSWPISYFFSCLQSPGLCKSCGGEWLPLPRQPSPMPSSTQVKPHCDSAQKLSNVPWLMKSRLLDRFPFCAMLILFHNSFWEYGGKGVCSVCSQKSSGR